MDEKDMKYGGKLYHIGTKVKDEDGCEGYVVIHWADGDICYLPNDAAHPNPRVIGHWTPEKVVGACAHQWVDARNEVVKSGRICIKCYAISADA